MGRVEERRKQELELNLISLSEELLKMCDELNVSIHLTANKGNRMSAFVHYDNPKLNSYGITSRIGITSKELRGILVEKPEWYTEVHDYDI